jgi:hypothetical protein
LFVIRLALQVRTGAALLACILAAGCHVTRPDDDVTPSVAVGPSPPGSAIVSSAGAPPDADPLPPLTGAWLERLSLDGFGDAFVSVPLGTTRPRAVMIGVHGMRDRPEWACGEWRGVSDAEPFILCPYGQPRDAPPGAGLTFSSAHELEAEIDAGLVALKARFGPYLLPGPMTYAGFSRGAILGVPILVAHPERYPRAILGEGGQDAWTQDAVRRYTAAGPRRVLFVCSTPVCERATRPVLSLFENAGVPVKLASAGDIGHLLDGRVVDATKPAWPWLAEDLPASSTPAPSHGME